MIECEYGSLRIFGRLQFMWRWQRGYLTFYGIALGETFFGVVR